jgi:hypothetical protein
MIPDGNLDLYEGIRCTTYGKCVGKYKDLFFLKKFLKGQHTVQNKIIT